MSSFQGRLPLRLMIFAIVSSRTSVGLKCISFLLATLAAHLQSVFASFRMIESNHSVLDGD